jgi:hypothetical protein
MSRPCIAVGIDFNHKTGPMETGERGLRQAFVMPDEADNAGFALWWQLTEDGSGEVVGPYSAFTITAHQDILAG